MKYERHYKKLWCIEFLHERVIVCSLFLSTLEPIPVLVKVPLYISAHLSTIVLSTFLANIFLLYSKKEKLYCKGKRLVLTMHLFLALHASRTWCQQRLETLDIEMWTSPLFSGHVHLVTLYVIYWRSIFNGGKFMSPHNSARHFVIFLF